jgi:hypothetical protein
LVLCGERDHMNWDAIGAAGEVFGAIAVLGSLIYLAFQVQQNSKLMKAKMKQQLTETSQENIYQMVNNAAVMIRVRDDVNVSDEDKLVVSLLHRASFRGYENYVYQHTIGLLDEEEWVGIQKMIENRFKRDPTFRLQWEAIELEFSTGLRSLMNSLKENSLGEKYS